MQTIQAPVDDILKILGKPKTGKGNSRWMTYVVRQPMADGMLLFHTLTRELVLLTPEEYASPDGIDELRQRWFRVSNTLRDKDFADQVRFVVDTMRAEPEHITSYSVFTTTDCNARCFYCFELGRSRITMSVKTAHKAANYIATHCGDNKVALHWFGGEPLLNKQVIDVICADLDEMGVTYRSDMMSNGLLFDEQTVERATERWALRKVQITLDGTEEVYNRCKAFVDAGMHSPYQAVMSNIEALLNAQVKVAIRLNMDAHNEGDLFALVDELRARFEGREGLSVYSHVLFEFAGCEELERSDEDRRKLYEKQWLLWDKLSEAGFMRAGGLAKTLPTNHCMADSGRCLTILPEGQLGLCDHYSEDNFVGNLDIDELDAQTVTSFRQRRGQIDACEDCFMYPECVRLEKCPESAECFPETREQALRRMQTAMDATYEAWLKGKETIDEEEAMC